MFDTKGIMAQAEAVALPFPDDFFHCVVTSPPYWGLRDYSGEEQMRRWGGDPDCAHEWSETTLRMQTGGLSAKQLTSKGVDGSGWISRSRTCRWCGQWIGALGHEPTPDQYVRNIVQVCREVRRVMRPEAVFWLNLGDSLYSYRGSDSGLPEGSRILVPHRAALALQTDGWLLREDNVWWKNNPMVENLNGWRWERHRIKLASADVDWRAEARKREGPLMGPGHVAGGNTGTKGYRPKWKLCPGCEKCIPHGGYIHRKASWRHTRAHEYIFQLATDRQYFVDLSLALERAGEHSHGASEPGAGPKQADLGQNQGSSTMGVKTEWRNPRSVFHVSSGTYEGAHYATFPEQLIAPLVRLSCAPRTCSICATPWSPVMDLDEKMRPSQKVGYRPSCDHQHAPPTPGWVLDPFFGSGTTGEVARSVGVNFAGTDIAYGYLSDNARIRAFGQTPPEALDDLPLFGME